MKKRSFIICLVLALSLTLSGVFAVSAGAAGKRITSEKQYWQAVYNFSKGGSSSVYLDLSGMKISSRYDFESPTGWKYGADKGYVITQDFDYNILRSDDGTYDYSTLMTIGRPTFTLKGVRLTWDTSSKRKQARAVQKKANAVVKKIIKPGMSKKQKVRAIKNYIVAHSKYKYDPNKKYLFNSYGALVKGKAACQGNAAAFNLLARKAGILSVMATNKKENHAWNLFKIGKSYYMIDCTMPGRMGSPTKVSGLKYSIYKKFDQKKYYKKLFKYVKMVKY